MEVKPGYKQTEVGVIPEEWEVFSLSDLTEPQRPISYGIVQTGPNVADGIRCLRVLDIHEGLINKSELITTSKEISDSYRRTVLRAGDLVMPLRGKVGDVGLVDEELEGANLTRGVALIAIRSGWSPVFCQQVISSTSTRRRLEQVMNGSALQEIPIASLRSFKISMPKTLPEQCAIATALSDVDGLLGGLDRLIAKKRDLKQAAMQQLLTGQTRLPGFHGEWEQKRFGELLKYERPDKFLVNSAEYLELGDIPVLTANKSFILGYTNDEFGVYENLPAIIFDDFTTDSKYVDFPFKVKSSAIKILKARSTDVNLQFIFAWMQLVDFPLGEHKRYYISEYQHIELPTPSSDEQTAIAEVLSDMDAELAALEQRREKTRALKQAMMQELLTGRTRLV